jgi:hypothetical protein
MNGIDTSIFRDEYQLIESGSAGEEPTVQATFDITIATQEQKKAFVAQCVQAYRLTIQEPNQLIWKTFQTYLINQLQILRKFLIIRNLHNTDLKPFNGNRYSPKPTQSHSKFINHFYFHFDYIHNI